MVFPREELREILCARNELAVASQSNWCIVMGRSRRKRHHVFIVGKTMLLRSSREVGTKDICRRRPRFETENAAPDNGDIKILVRVQQRKLDLTSSL